MSGESTKRSLTVGSNKLSSSVNTIVSTDNKVFTVSLEPKNDDKNIETKGLCNNISY